MSNLNRQSSVEMYLDSREVVHAAIWQSSTRRHKCGRSVIEARCRCNSRHFAVGHRTDGLTLECNRQHE